MYRDSFHFTNARATDEESGSAGRRWYFMVPWTSSRPPTASETRESPSRFELASVCPWPLAVAVNGREGNLRPPASSLTIPFFFSYVIVDVTKPPPLPLSSMTQNYFYRHRHYHYYGVMAFTLDFFPFHKSDWPLRNSPRHAVLVFPFCRWLLPLFFFTVLATFVWRMKEMIKARVNWPDWIWN